LEDKKDESGIIYCLSRRSTEELAEDLKENGFLALPYHAGLDRATRQKNQDLFAADKVKIVVATIAFGMGIDKSNVRYVVHMDLPKNIESYYQETGRAGRDGGEGHCLAFYSYKDIEKLEKFLHGKPVSEIEIGKQLLHEIVSYAETSICRRKYLLHYFGEVFDDSKCTEMCDNCRHPREKYDGQVFALNALKVAEVMRDTQKIKYLTNFIMGVKTSEITSYKHDQHKLFGVGKENAEHFWNAVFRQLLVAGLLHKDIETYGIIKLTDAGRAFIKDPKPFTLIKESDYTGDGHEDSSFVAASKGALDDALYSMLVDLRKTVAKKHKLPPFVIFQEVSLKEMALQYPITIEELTHIQGVGQGKATRYGKDFIELIARYVEDNEIDRPTDLVMKSIVNKSGLKVQMIQNIDKKLPLDDIAKAQSKTFVEILDEIEGIVQSGTRVNINYYIDGILDSDNQEEIFDYFKEAETDSITDAYHEFDGDYTEEELRLMRIKFFSEMGN
jgi:ATP-dependent DNA helicase RecQ